MIRQARLTWVFLLAVLLLTCASDATAQNTTNGSSFGYIVGQGPMNIFIGNTVGTDTERWYTTGLVQGKSYCFETFRANSEYTFDLDLNIELIRASDNVVLNTFNGSTGDPAFGSNSRWTRGCLVAAATQQYFVRLVKSVCCTGRAGNFQFRIVDTTLHSPWWYVNAASGYDDYMEIANTTTVSVSLEVTVRGANGSVVASYSGSLAARGTVLLSVGQGLSAPISSGAGSGQIAHNGPPGAIVANITTLSGYTGLSFDAPFEMRQGFK